MLVSDKYDIPKRAAEPLGRMKAVFSMSAGQIKCVVHCTGGIIGEFPWWGTRVYIHSLKLYIGILLVNGKVHNSMGYSTSNHSTYMTTDN